MICAAWKWQHENLPRAVRVKDAPNDYGVVQVMHDVLSNADVIVHHNGDAFDIKKFNARAISYQLKPVKPLIQIDTLKIARKHFKFTSNRLDFLGEFLGVGKKMDTPKGLWRRATEGNQEAIKLMAQYNKRDVLLLEDVYNKLKPYTPAKFNLNHVAPMQNEQPVLICPSCGSADTIRQGKAYTRASVAQKRQCKPCGHWFIESKGKAR